MPLPDRLPIEPVSSIDTVVEVPGSKSLSNRAVLIAGLAKGPSKLHGVLDCDDTQAMAACFGGLGVPVVQKGTTWSVQGVDGRPGPASEPLFVRASGTAARFLTAVSALVEGGCIIDGVERIRERPIRALVDACNALGASIVIEGPHGSLPVRSMKRALAGGEVEIDASRSSQYVSALLLVAPYAKSDVVVHLQDRALASRPYVDLTLQAMQRFGAQVHWVDDASLFVRAGAGYVGQELFIEPDASSAAYFFAAAAITGGRIRVLGLTEKSLQADVGLLPILRQMGCRVDGDDKGVTVVGPAVLQAVDVDMNRLPDAVMAMGAVAAFANGTTTLRNVGNLRIKETDRLDALQAELRRLGALVETGSDWIRITARPLYGAVVETYDDHRVAMSMALVGLKIPGVVIADPACVSKSWPGYFDSLRTLGPAS